MQVYNSLCTSHAYQYNRQVPGLMVPGTDFPRLEACSVQSMKAQKNERDESPLGNKRLYIEWRTIYVPDAMTQYSNHAYAGPPIGFPLTDFRGIARLTIAETPLRTTLIRKATLSPDM
jgi:hypothetical protein